MSLNIDNVGQPGNLNVASMSNRQQNKRYQALKSEDEKTILGTLARESTNFVSDFGSQAHGIFNCVYTANGKVSPTAIQAFGAISALSLPLSIIAAREAHLEALAHRKIKNLWGECTSWIKCVTSSIQAAAGVLYLPAQVLMVVLLYSASKTASVAASILNMAGTGLLAAGSLLFAVTTCLDLHRQILLRDDLHGILVKRDLSEKEKNENALFYLHEKIKKSGKLELVRLIGTESVDAIRRADIDKAGEVVQQTLKESNKAIALSAVSLSFTLVGMALSVLGVVFSGGTVGLVVMLTGVLIGLVWLGMDIYNLKEAFQDAKRGEFDRTWLISTTVICSLATIAASTLSQGLTLFILTLLIGSIWAAVNLSSFILLSSQKSSET